MKFPALRIRLIGAALCGALPVAALAADPLPAATSTGNLLQVVFGLLIVLALMGGAAWLLKRFNLQRGAGNQAIKIVGGVSVGSRERVMVLEVADQWIVVGVAPGRVSALATLPRQETPPPAAEATADAPNFASWLKQSIDKQTHKRNADQA